MYSTKGRISVLPFNSVHFNKRRVSANENAN
nr:MAG TPA: hypothetical protein [Caudoviricetes sp.]DAZ72172.1 MAG TPA: hypothetical protein [Caudoviricetes sp.]